MTYGRTAILAILILAASAGAGFAQTDDANFYADPILPDTPLTVAHAYDASEATAEVAAVAPAAGKATPALRLNACTAFNPCAAVSPARS